MERIVTLSCLASAMLAPLALLVCSVLVSTPLGLAFVLCFSVSSSIFTSLFCRPSSTFLVVVAAVFASSSANEFMYVYCCYCLIEAGTVRRPTSASSTLSVLFTAVLLLGKVSLFVFLALSLVARLQLLCGAPIYTYLPFSSFLFSLCRRFLPGRKSSSRLRVYTQCR